MAANTFKLPVSSYDEVCKIIKGYARFSEPVDLKKVSSVCAMPPTSISANAGFLVSTGIVTEGQSKQSTPRGQKLGLALEHDIPMETAAAWREIVYDTEFLANMLAAVRIRKGMDIEALQNHISYSAGVAKDKRSVAGSRTIANILVASGLLREQDGKLVATDEEAPGTLTEGVNTTASGSRQGTVLADQRLHYTTPSLQVHSLGQGVTVSIKVNVSVTADQLDGLGLKLRHVLDELRQTAVVEESVEETPRDRPDEADVVHELGELDSGSD